MKTTELYRVRRSLPMLETLFRDFRYALRSLRKVRAAPLQARQRTRLLKKAPSW